MFAFLAINVSFNGSLTRIFYSNLYSIANPYSYIEDITRVVILYEIIKRAFGEFDKFHMK